MHVNQAVHARGGGGIRGEGHEHGQCMPIKGEEAPPELRSGVDQEEPLCLHLAPPMHHASMPNRLPPLVVHACLPVGAIQQPF